MKDISDLQIEADIYLWVALNDELFRHHQKNCYIQSFSLFAEDAIIKGISKRYDVPIKHYVDIGANHPYIGNATIAFYLDGATGCLVEPNPEFTGVLKCCRPFDSIYNVGIASENDAGKKNHIIWLKA